MKTRTGLGSDMPHVSDRPSYPGELALTCEACGLTASYAPGAIVFDAEAARTDAHGRRRMEDYFAFSAYFRCRRCNAGGPWRFPQDTKGTLRLLVLGSVALKGQGQVCFGRLSLLDRTPIRYATEAEAILKDRIGAHPEDATLWVRLGNLYRAGGRPDLAEAPYRKALELDPHDLEARFSLGLVLWEREEGERSAGHFHHLLASARTATHFDRRTRLRLVRGALRELIEIHEATGGKIPILPEPEVAPRDMPRAPGSFRLLRLDPSREEDLDRIAACFLGEDPGPAPSNPRASRPFVPASVPRRLGRRSDAPPPPAHPRNAPCPCGSGRKYKNCCGRGP